LFPKLAIIRATDKRAGALCCINHSRAPGVAAAAYVTTSSSHKYGRNILQISQRRVGPVSFYLAQSRLM